MRTVQLHPFSLLAGAGIAVLAVVATGQQVVPTGQTPPRSECDPVLVRQPAFAVHPRDFVQIKEGVPYTVPVGRVFVPRGIGGSKKAANIVWPATLVVDGIDEVSAPAGFYINSGGSAGYAASFGNGTSLKSVPIGLSVGAGSVVEVIDADPNTPDDARAWGYLADA